MIGTPAYMAPEQAEGRTHQIGPATDVYAPGAILYECLTGRVPFKGTTAHETLNLLLTQEPEKPRSLNADVPRDLETICLRCLEKDPRKRYAGAAELAADLGRFRRGEPVAARPVGRLERTWRWCNRNPAVAGLLATALLFAGVATALAIVAYRKADDERQANAATTKALRDVEVGKNNLESALEKSRFEQKKAEFVAYSFRLDAARQDINSNKLGDALLKLQAMYEPGLCGWEYAYLSRQCQKEIWAVPGGMGPVWSVAFSPDGKRLVAGGSENLLAVRDANTGEELLTLKGHKGAVLGVGFSPVGARVVSGGADGTVKEWNATTGQEIRSFRGHTGAVFCVAFSPDGKRIVSGGDDNTIHVWGPSTLYESVLTLKGHTDAVLGVAFSPDGKRILSGSLDETAKVWDAVTGQESFALKGHKGPILCVAFSPDGKRIVTGSGDEYHHSTLKIGERLQFRQLRKHQQRPVPKVKRIADDANVDGSTIGQHDAI